MDIFSHALWTTAAGIGARKKLKQPAGLGGTMGCSSRPGCLDRTCRCQNLALSDRRVKKRCCPTEWTAFRLGVGTVCNGTHSALVFAVCFAAIWLLLRKPPLEMLGWALHILIDVFTHRGLFAVKFLWPVLPVPIDGIRWQTPWFLAANFTVLAAVYLLLWIYRARGSSGEVETEGSTADAWHE